MRVYLVQHGKAKSAEEDPNRGLSDEGREEVIRSAHFLKERRISVALIQHSGKLRAEQTAHIFAEIIRCAGGPCKADAMSPEDDPNELTNFLRIYDDDILVIGHLPHLERVAGALLANNPDRRPVRFRNAGIVCLEKTPDGVWSLLWAVTPEILGTIHGALAA
jgi:phosphohistidine phosphatase